MTTPTTPAVGGTWSTDPGNSAPPPSSVPAYLGIVVTSSTNKSGSQISGNIVHLVVVQVDPGYTGNPGHEGTGVIVAIIQ